MASIKQDGVGCLCDPEEPVSDELLDLCLT